jgi:threonyl-tRNA synthetase
MIHAAIAGSLERFSAVLIEHLAGNFPVWISPVQVHFVPVSEKHLEGTKAIAAEFEAAGIRVELDPADETVGKKIRNAAKTKVPYIVVVGDNELNGADFTIRVRGQEEQLTMSKADMLDKVLTEIKDKTM